MQNVHQAELVAEAALNSLSAEYSAVGRVNFRGKSLQPDGCISELGDEHEPDLAADY